MPEAALGRIARVEAWALRAPIATPVVTSFGTMRDRPAVFVRLTGDDGAQGWGEVWCNFPGVGAEHRARLLIDTVAPLVIGSDWVDPESLFRRLEAGLAVLALQTGEPGPLAQTLAGIDIAAWDLSARRAGQPLWRRLGGASGNVAVYASGLHPDEAVAMALRMRERGHRAFKLKVGFGSERDVSSLRGLRDALGDGATLMVDANQAWTTASGTAEIEALAPMRPLWIEEPLAADQSPAAWATLAAASPVPLAAGENLRGDAQFDAHIASHALAFVQPDVGKWGGLSGCRGVARRALAGGAEYCPHWLGGPIGLLASMHLRAAMGESGWCEWDANPNPIHQRLAAQLPQAGDGRLTLGTEAGLGLAIGMRDFADLVSWQGDCGA
jgi:L-alanine-DL-glutamate epimerase-like enolase superfamily enzyme